jgi:hypothetical protein
MLKKLGFRNAGNAFDPQQKFLGVLDNDRLQQVDTANAPGLALAAKLGYSLSDNAHPKYGGHLALLNASDPWRSSTKKRPRSINTHGLFFVDDPELKWLGARKSCL